MEVLVADDKLRNEILSDAQAKAERIIKKAEKDAAAAAENAENQTEDYEVKIKNEFAKFLEDAQHRVFAAVDIESKKAQIKYVGDVIDEIFDTVKDDILSGKFIKYEDFILTMIKKSCEQLDCDTYTMFIGEREQNAVPAKDILSVKPKRGKITAAEKRANSDGYTILSDDGKHQIFLSLNDYMDRLKSEKRMEIFNMLSKN
jgi:vacuolar-type H+-ATPase subunit E/Vma4